MGELHLKAEPLSAEAFAPYGDVIETAGSSHFAMNSGTFERFHDLAEVDTDLEPGGRVVIGIVRCNRPTLLPARIELIERHPLGSQAFIPLGGACMLLVVAPPGEKPVPAQLHAFVSDGRQGINYHRGTWHAPLVAFEPGQEFIVVDRGGSGENCDEIRFDVTDTVIVEQLP